MKDEQLDPRDLVLQVLESRAINDKELSLQILYAQESVRRTIAESRLNSAMEQLGALPPIDAEMVSDAVEAEAEQESE